MSKSPAQLFNDLVRSLISRLEKKSRSDLEVANLDRLRKRIGLLKSTLGDNALIAAASPFFIQYADHILNQDAEARDGFFLNMDIRGEYLKKRGTVEKQDEFIFSLTDSIKQHYTRARPEERAEVYSEVKSMLEACLEYTIAAQAQ